MCGICGVINSSSEPIPLSLLQEMTRTLHHRGPDSEGYEQVEGASLGFQRLAIIDVQSGGQPMSNEDDTLWITFNGEIYNFQSLRKQIEDTGRHRFKTHCDTEVILHLYEEYGENCLQDLRGMFAFAIWDRKKKRLFAARDRFGKKPFVYFPTRQRGIAFASELKALQKHPDFPTKIDLSSIHLYLSLQYVPAPRTIYEGVYKLPAAHCLTWSASEGIQVRRYWDLKYDPKELISYQDAKHRLREQLEESVRLRMISDVPLGAFLSGGIDSSVVVSLMAQNSSRPIKTFSIGFEEETYSEIPYARSVAKRYHTDHHEFIVRPALIDILPKLAWYYSEPFADSSALPSYYLSQQTREHVTVALSGDGGDEVFAGYHRYRAMAAMRFWNVLPSSLRRAALTATRGLTGARNPEAPLRKLQRLLRTGTLVPPAQYLRTLEYFHSEELRELWEPAHQKEFDKASLSSLELFESTLQRSSPASPVDRWMFLDLNHYLPDCLMIKIDIASMANSLEVRSPFLDHKLVEECARWPSSWKYRPLGPTKKILKDVFSKDLPAPILRRRKQGFGVPISQWFRGPLKNYLRETLLSPRALSRGYFRPKVLERFIHQHESGVQDRSYGLWALLMLELWHQEYIDKKDHHG